MIDATISRARLRDLACLGRPDQRAGVLSVLFTISYLGLGIPAVAAGFAVAKGGGLVATSYEYGVAVIVLAALATVNLIRLRTHNHGRAKGPAPLASAPGTQPCRCSTWASIGNALQSFPPPEPSRMESHVSSDDADISMRNFTRSEVDRWARGREALRAADPRMVELIDADPGLDPDALFDGWPSDLWGALVLQVIGQQLSRAAASAILGRLEALHGSRLPTPAELLDTDAEDARTSACRSSSHHALQLTLATTYAKRPLPKRGRRLRLTVLTPDATSTRMSQCTKTDCRR